MKLLLLLFSAAVALCLGTATGRYTLCVVNNTRWYKQYLYGALRRDVRAGRRLAAGGNGGESVRVCCIGVNGMVVNMPPR